MTELAKRIAEVDSPMPKQFRKCYNTMKCVYINCIECDIAVKMLKSDIEDLIKKSENNM